MMDEIVNLRCWPVLAVSLSTDDQEAPAGTVGIAASGCGRAGCEEVECQTVLMRITVTPLLSTSVMMSPEVARDLGFELIAAADKQDGGAEKRRKA